MRVKNLPSFLTFLPTIMVMVFCFYGAIVWTFLVSLTSSRLLPKITKDKFVGIEQYVDLFDNSRWQVAIGNLVIFAVGYLVFCLTIGILLAIFIDQRIRAEGFFRTIFLYPLAVSFVVTGLIWQWVLNPELGFENLMHHFGFANFKFDWIVSTEKSIYTIIIAGVWHGSGLMMALMLAGLRGISEDIWKASKVDAIPAWRVYWHIVLPSLRPIIFTAIVLGSISIIKSYDLVVAMTGGGPGISSDLPSKFVMDQLFNRANLGRASAAAIVMVMATLIALSPYYYMEYIHKAQRR